MENKARALAAGAFVLGVSALLLVLAVWLTRQAGEVRSYELATRYRISGLVSQAGVQYRGVRVG